MILFSRLYWYSFEKGIKNQMVLNMCGCVSVHNLQRCRYFIYSLLRSIFFFPLYSTHIFFNLYILHIRIEMHGIPKWLLTRLNCLWKIITKYDKQKHWSHNYWYSILDVNKRDGKCTMPMYRLLCDKNW